MTSSAISSIKPLLEGYLAGQVAVERVVTEVTAVYFRGRSKGEGSGLRPVVEVIERAAPGVLELASSADRPGFAMRAGERPFPKQYEPALRSAVERVLHDAGWGMREATVVSDHPASGRPATGNGWLARLALTLRRVLGRGAS
jgi:hypothetical protein